MSVSTFQVIIRDAADVYILYSQRVHAVTIMAFIMSSTGPRGVFIWIRIAICDAIWANCESNVKLIRNFANQK